jgi:hypothetical protein
MMFNIINKTGKDQVVPGFGIVKDVMLINQERKNKFAKNYPRLLSSGIFEIVPVGNVGTTTKKAAPAPAPAPVKAPVKKKAAAPAKKAAAPAPKKKKVDPDGPKKKKAAKKKVSKKKK